MFALYYSLMFACCQASPVRHDGMRLVWSSDSRLGYLAANRQVDEKIVTVNEYCITGIPVWMATYGY